MTIKHRLLYIGIFVITCIQSHSKEEFLTLFNQHNPINQTLTQEEYDSIKQKQSDYIDRVHNITQENRTLWFYEKPFLRDAVQNELTIEEIFVLCHETRLLEIAEEQENTHAVFYDFVAPLIIKRLQKLPQPECIIHQNNVHELSKDISAVSDTIDQPENPIPHMEKFLNLCYPNRPINHSSLIHTITSVLNMPIVYDWSYWFINQ